MLKKHKRIHYYKQEVEKLEELIYKIKNNAMKLILPHMPSDVKPHVIQAYNVARKNILFDI